MASSSQPIPTSTSAVPRTIEEKIQFAAKLKEEGNDFFKQANYSKALAKYTKIFAYINGLKAPEMGVEQMLPAAQDNKTNQPNESQGSNITQLELTTNSNISACYLKLNEPRKAIQYVEKVLAKDANNSKALFRRGCAYLAVNELDNAETDLQAALKITPNDAGIKNQLIIVKRKTAEHEEKVRKGFANAFKSLDLSVKRKKSPEATENKQ
jgi:FK506-binding protein 4/5